jgi:hypothetical protein
MDEWMDGWMKEASVTSVSTHSMTGHLFSQLRSPAASPSTHRRGTVGLSR